jgi:hypothetical protein
MPGFTFWAIEAVDINNKTMSVDHAVIDRILESSLWLRIEVAWCPPIAQRAFAMGNLVSNAICCQAGMYG